MGCENTEKDHSLPARSAQQVAAYRSPDQTAAPSVKKYIEGLVDCTSGWDWGQARAYCFLACCRHRCLSQSTEWPGKSNLCLSS